MHDAQRLYHDLAWIWPIMSPPEEYVQETEWISRIIRQYAEIGVKTILHLGCGGGHIDLTLKKHFQVTGVDLSDEMLALARVLNPEVTYF
ncbi:methyltransferase type 11 [Candidatus Vecturithrix granuli]|uniref:Methyltransferase type 11 n=1 Tax=Vecturithrix granuli TaxID=1499967 RepID=A0A081C044_VECG1|nr:methyltransferase type 11 [Candidatus Vecturithrix granuli]